MAGTVNNLHKSQGQWDSLREKASRRSFANRTDSRVRSGAIRRGFQNARLAEIAAKAEADS